MDERIDLALLARYFDGGCTAEEQDLVRAWIGDDLGRRAAVAELATAWSADAHEFDATYDAGRAWARMTGRLAPALRRRRSSGRWALAASRAASVTAWAAAVVVAVGLGTWWIAGRQSARPAGHVASAAAEREYRTKRAQRAIVRLADGSEVTLNAASTLRVPADFGAEHRDLYFEGEAYFDVAHDSAAPFTVHTANGMARDLGTRFTVRSYGDERTKKLEVVVAEGAVSISVAAGRDSLVLRAEEAGWLTDDGQIRAERGVDVAERLGWIVGRLEFKNVPVRDVLPVVSRWYDADFALGDDGLANYPLTVTLTGERLHSAIDVIARALNARAVARGSQTVFIRKSGGAHE